MTSPAHLQPVYGNEVAVGDELPVIETSLDATTMVLQVSGSQDWNPTHHDPEFAAESGLQGIFYNTGWTTGLLGRLVSDWAGPEGWVQRLAFQMRGMHMTGDTVRAAGRVVAVHMNEDHAVVDLDVWLESDRQGVATPGTASVRLPVRPDQ
jgi:acyl dehydratase